MVPTLRPTLSLLVLLLAIVSPGYAQSGVAEPEPITAGLTPVPGAYENGMDVLHYALELALDSGSPRFDARATITTTLADPPPAELAFDLSGLTVHGVTVAGQEAAFRLDGGRLLVHRGAASGTVEVVVRYGGVPDDGLILRDNVHGAPAAFADNWPNRARFWFPSVDHPRDKATVEFRVHASDSWTVIANGYLVTGPAPTQEGALGGHEGKRTWHWRTDVDIPTYTMVVGAADLEVRSVGLAACGSAPVSRRDDGCVDVTYWAFPQDVDKAEPSFRRAAEMTDFFTELIGPFPYEKMANVQSATRFGGMENASAIFYSEQAIAEGRNIEGTVSHEIAHQWFGDSVTEADWHHVWLSEGFATYFGNLYFEFADGVESMRQRMEEDRDQYLESGDGARPVVDLSERDLFGLLNRNSYQKGGWVLHMLRHTLGDEAFFAGIRSYYAEFRDDRALTDDLRRHMEAAGNTELDWFFDQWLFRPGHPVLDVSWAQGDGSGILRVEQRQDAGWPVFRFPLTVDLVGEDGSSHRVEVQVEERSHMFRIDVQGRRTVVVDPEGNLLTEARE